MPPVSETPSVAKTKHQQKRGGQDAQAHASSTAYRRAAQGSGPKKRPRGTAAAASGTFSRWLLPVTEKDIAQQQGSRVLAWIKTGPLDPFLRLPVELDMNERNMLFHYLDTTPRTLHGVKRNPVYCPVRECSLVCLINSPLLLQWTIFMGEILTGAPKTAIYARRAAICAETRKLLQDPANLRLDMTLMFLSVAGLAESRLGNTEVADKHFAGLLQLLKMRNGLRTVQEIGHRLGFGMLHALIVGHVPLFQTRIELVDALDRMTLPRATKPVHPLIRRYFTAFCFRGPHIANLHMLNTIMEREPEGFMDRLVYNITGSGDSLTPLALTFIIGQSALEVGEWFGPNPALRTWETIEFIQLLTYAIVSKEDTVKAMSSWLTGVVSGTSDVDLEELKVEILDQWDLAHDLGLLSIEGLISSG